MTRIAFTRYAIRDWNRDAYSIDAGFADFKFLPLAKAVEYEEESWLWEEKSDAEMETEWIREDEAENARVVPVTIIYEVNEEPGA